MGYSAVSVKVTAVLDEHAGDKEREHLEKWKELQKRLAHVVKDPLFRDIGPEIYTDLDG